VRDSIRLPGGDDISDTVIENDEILRIYKSEESFHEAISVLKIIHADPRFNNLVVHTNIHSDASKQFTLQHAMLSFNFLENWTLNQYLNVLDAHLNLLRILSENGLVLKDHLPENFVLDHGNPVFVDFSSVVTKSTRNKTSWINQARGSKSIEKYLISELMYPFMLLPLFVGLINSEHEMRQILKYEYCNSGSPSITWKRVSFKNLFIRFNPVIAFRVSLFLLCKNFYRSETRTLAKAIKLLRILLRKSIRKSNYLSYYQNKAEQFNFENPHDWNCKQASVLEVIKRTKPADVLDIGSNTGWFSILAAKNNCRVKSLDIDPVIVDHLYLCAKKEKLDIEPSVQDFESLAILKEIRLSDREQPLVYSRKLPSFSYDADMVLALGLIHHLVLGLGYSLERIMQLMSALSRHTLVLEFVSLDDEKIVSEQEFFPDFHQSKSAYTKDSIIKFGLDFFDKVEIFPSNPISRELLVFSRS
jgi:SAM-dependent methyltransferase